MMTKILIADDHYVIRVGTSLILRSKIEDLTIDYATQYSEVISKITKEDYDLLILDIEMPGSKHREMITEIKNKNKNLKILLYTSHEHDIIAQYVREGADGYLHKSSGESDIFAAINSMLQYGNYYPPSLVSQIAKESKNRPPIEKLSGRELQIFDLLAKGYTNIEISHILEISISSVSTYKKRIYEKLDVNNIAELITLRNDLH
ncbi:response regulator transcription factor [Elizabethkingia miricola]|uniref:response regulator transcription factor n=1 Tax=Elizabethkingia miricola TaxID=172045 RepID=UPI002ACEF30B|nr:response regulator transcription factor [Elizabethkingia miricola]WQM39444.1 response regulator transcription factor [Elizabethkingia miricola]